MATQEHCSVCEKGKGAYFCIGCKKYFCKKDFQNHREILNNELDGFVENHNVLQEKITKATQQKDISSPLLSQIDRWQKITIEKVKQTADQARQHVIQILNSKPAEIKSDFAKFSKELIQLKETEDFAEQDLKRLQQTIDQLNQNVKKLAQPSDIELNVDKSQEIEWNRLIDVVDNTNYVANQQERKGDSEDTETKPIVVDIGILPTAPRAAVDIDYSTVPNNAPFVAHIVNLSFEIDDEGLRRIFADLNPKSARIIRDGNRSRGIGLVEFETRENLIDGLKRTGKESYGRKIRVNVSDKTDSHQTDSGRVIFGNNRSNRSGGVGGEERPGMADRWKRVTERNTII